MFILEDYLRACASQVDGLLDQLVPSGTTQPARLHQAMRHSLFGSGKRMRPALCLAAADSIRSGVTGAALAGAAVELLHTYTLVHDDLPAMDDDVLRRGRPTCHVAFDEATAILAGDALLTLAFRVLADVPCLPSWTALDLIRELGNAAGSTGVIGGQMADIEGEGQPLSIDQLVYIHTHKTGDLILASVRMGAMTAGATALQLKALDSYAAKIGLAFQIADDVLNATGNASQLGKSVGTDAEAGKMTYVSAYGVEGARSKARGLIDDAVAALRELPGATRPLEAIAHYVIDRKS